MLNSPTPTVFVIDDDASVRESLEFLIRCNDWEPQAFASAQEFLSRPRSSAPCCLIFDVNLPGLSGLEIQKRLAAERNDMPVIFLTRNSDLRMAVRDVKGGALEFFAEPADDQVFLSAIQNAIRQVVQYNPLKDESGNIVRSYGTGTGINDQKRTEGRLLNKNFVLREQIDRDSISEEIVGSSEALRRVLRQVAKVAPTDSTVLILGETGTGKELIARAIHKRSNRAERPFIGVNCAAIPQSLIASELFGHEKGAFTGATQRRLGRFESANGGTLFLDEVGDLPAEIQIALLRVLQEREVERVGASKPIPVDVRVLAATHRDLNALVEEGKFRQDLLYRLNVVPIEMPSLRERKGDIPLLVEYYIDRFGRKAGKKFRTIDKKSLELLQLYGWPGNIRELQNVIERSVILCEDETFSVEETWLRPEVPVSLNRTTALNGVLLKQEKEMIEAALAESQGQISGLTGAATKLDLPARTLDSKIKRLRINKYQFKVPHAI